MNARLYTRALKPAKSQRPVYAAPPQPVKFVLAVVLNVVAVVMLGGVL